MSKVCIIAVILMLTSCSAGVLWGRRDNLNNEEEAYFGTATIKGKVEILNHPTLGRTEGRGVYLAFQRQDCRQCVFGVRSDADGNYQAFVSPGQYKLIVRDGSRQGKTKDALAPKQQRIIQIERSGSITNFNVEMVLPRD